MASQKAAWKFKIVLFGEGGVGKTSLIIRYVRSHFSDEVKKTIGTNFLVKDVTIDGELIRLLVWDIAGQEQFFRMHKFFFNSANGALGVFDVTRVTTFEEMPKWLNSMRANCDCEIPAFLLGNKIDLPRRVTTEQAQEFAREMKCDYLETSAKENINVEEAFTTLARKCLAIAKDQE